MPRHPGSGKRLKKLCNRWRPIIIPTQRADFVFAKPSRNTTTQTSVGASTSKQKFSSPAAPTKVGSTYINSAPKPNRPVPGHLGQYSVFVAFLEQGDEVILFEPFFDQYLPSVVFNGGVPVYVPLHPETGGVDNPTGRDWKIHFDELRFVSVCEREFRTEGLVLDVRSLPEQR